MTVLSKMAEPPKNGVLMVVFLTEVDFRSLFNDIEFISKVRIQ